MVFWKMYRRAKEMRKNIDFDFPVELQELMETLAEHVHDEWMKGRMAAGWTYGPKRDDDKKQTPCMVPYSKLPEEEKEYDRRTAMITIQCILQNGYEITKK